MRMTESLRIIHLHACPAGRAHETGSRSSSPSLANWFGRNRPRTQKPQWMRASRSPRHGRGRSVAGSSCTASIASVTCSKRDLVRDQGPAPAPKPILLLGHLDTVWPAGHACCHALPHRSRPPLGPGRVRYEDRQLPWPSPRSNCSLKRSLLRREIVLLLVSDEEVGSPVSRPITEAIAKTCDAVYVLEPAQGLAYKTARKGTGNWRIEVKGVAAHAGVDFEKGASAIRELARVVERVSGWTDLKRGLTVSVGVAGGGTKSNVIPAQAWAEVDVRIARKADGPRITRKFTTLKAADPRCSLDCHRRHQPAAHGARPRNGAAFRKGAGARRRSRLRARRSRDRRRLRRQFHRGPRHSHARRHGSCGRGRTLAA